MLVETSSGTFEVLAREWESQFVLPTIILNLMRLVIILLNHLLLIFCRDIEEYSNGKENEYINEN
jgi:hypothetical protein